MPQNYDTVCKRLVASDPMGFLQFAGYTATSCQLVSSQVTYRQGDADGVIRYGPPYRLAHFELQSTYDPQMGERMLSYDVALCAANRLEVDGVVILLRPEADGPNMNGYVHYDNLRYKYRIIRLWEQDTDALFELPVSMLAFAPLCNVDEDGLPGLLKRIDRQVMSTASSHDIRLEFWTITAILLGLKMNTDKSVEIIGGAIGMDALEQSSFYKYIVDKGRQEGRKEGRQEGIKAGEQIGGLNEARRLVVLIGHANFGKIPDTHLARLNTITSLEKLEELLLAVNKVSNWDELLPGG